MCIYIHVCIYAHCSFSIENVKVDKSQIHGEKINHMLQREIRQQITLYCLLSETFKQIDFFFPPDPLLPRKLSLNFVELLLFIR